MYCTVIKVLHHRADNDIIVRLSRYKIIFYSMADKKVIIYSTPTCMYCRMAKEFFTDNKIEYVEHDVAVDLSARKDMFDKTHQGGVPVIDIDGQVIVGFDEDKIRELLGL